MKTKLEALHQASMTILNQTGCLVHHPEALALMKKHGVRVDGERVYFTEDQILSQIRKAPSTFRLRAVNPANDITVGGGESHYAPGAGVPYVVDEGGEVRGATLDDFITYTKLFHSSAHITLMSSATLTPTDLPPEASSLRALYQLALLSDKPFWVLNGKGAINRQIFGLLEIMFGEELSPDRPPLALTVSNPLSPLSFDHQAVSALFDFSARGQGVIVAPCAMAGSTAPVTLAGAIAQTNAETLVGVALSQMIAPGAPVVYGFQSTAADMKTGAIAIGSPEQGVCAKYGAELARFYGLPSRGGGALTDASGPGRQSACEAMLTLLATRQAGMNLIIHTAGIVGGFAALNLEQAVLGLEMAALAERYLQDITIDERNLALDVIDNVGPGGQFLTSPHTVKNCRRSLYGSRLAHRGALEGTDYLAAESRRIEEEKNRLLNSYAQPDLGASRAEDLKRFMRGQGLL